MLIEAKVKVSRVIDAKVRKKSETYLMEEEFFSRVEYVITQTLTEEVNDGTVKEFEIQSLKISPIKEMATQFTGEHIFIATLRDLWTDDNGTEKQLKYKILLWANDLTDANTKVHQLAREGYNMLIEGIKQVDYIFLNSEENDEGLS